ncbi:MAG: hypothetical protein LH629_03430 [Ignavibacteria bacterium]|nr:hypothetical protein [Ignavibacteria bacterium]
MKTIKFILVLTITVLLTSKTYSQGMMPPEPVKSPVMESMMGTWVSEPYEMFGMKMTDEIIQSMILNGQFLEIGVQSMSPDGFKYEGKGIMVPDKDGSFTGWMFDIFGKNGITTYTGKTEDNKMTMTGISPMMTENREIIMDGDKMTQNVSFLMKDEKGNVMPEMKMTIIYNKKK